MPITRNDSWEQEATFLTTDLETDKPVTFRKLEGPYPNTDAGIPTEKAPITIGFNPEYMMKICQQYKKADIRFIEFSLYGLTEKMMLKGTNSHTGQGITTILMPCKVNNETWNVGVKKEKKNKVLEKILED